jgi:hypothetical protein
MILLTYQANAGTWRMLVDGKVHPRLVGFDTERDCIGRAQSLIDNGELRRDDYGAFTVIDTDNPAHPQYEQPTRPYGGAAHEIVMAEFDAADFDKLSST